MHLGARYVATIRPAAIVAQMLHWFLRRPDWDIDRCLAAVRGELDDDMDGKIRYWILQAEKFAPPHLKQLGRTVSSTNLVPLLLRAELATLISGTTVTPTFKANYIALGDGDTAPAAGDTQLENELVRGSFEDRSAEGASAFLNKFFTAADVGGTTYQEIGIFVDASGTPDSGYILSRSLLEMVLAIDETLTLNVTFDVNPT